MHHSSEPPPADTSVAVVIPCVGARGLAWGERRWFAVEAVRSLVQRAGRRSLDVVVVHTEAVDTSLLNALLGLGDFVRLVPFAGAYDHPRMVNLGVVSTTAEVVIALNEHIEVVSDGFVDELVGPLGDEDVGLTGPRLLGSNGTLVNAGLAFFSKRVQPMFEGVLADEPGPEGLLTVTHECSGLSGGCLALRRATFDQVGGWNPRLPVLSDVDLSFKLRHVGLKRLWVAGATAYRLLEPHRAERPEQHERQALRTRWHAPPVDEHVPTFGAWRAERELLLSAGASEGEG
jgi:hypothetical protein